MSRKLKTAIILGKYGQLARHLRHSLSTHYQLIVLGSKELDLQNIDAIIPALQHHQADILINPAAYTAVDLAEQEASKADLINHQAVKKIASYCQQNNIPLIHYSTDYVFDGKSKRAYLETDPTSPLGVYGQSKRLGEQAVLASGAIAFILRTSWVYSKVGKNFYKTMLALAQNRDEINVVADQFGSPTYAGSIADATKCLMDQLFLDDLQKQKEHLENLSGIYHFSCQGETHWCDFARAIFRLNQLQHIQVNPISTEQYPTPVERPVYSVLNKQKIHKVFDLSLPSWQDALQACFDSGISDTQ